MAAPINTSPPTLAANGDWSVGSWTSADPESTFYTVELFDVIGEAVVSVLQDGGTDLAGNGLPDLVTAGPGQYRVVVTADCLGDVSTPVDGNTITYPADSAAARRRKAHHHAAAMANRG
jgi:hypothetical protein